MKNLPGPGTDDGIAAAEAKVTVFVGGWPSSASWPSFKPCTRGGSSDARAAKRAVRYIPAGADKAQVHHFARIMLTDGTRAPSSSTQRPRACGTCARL
jgi:hypothetical protein